MRILSTDWVKLFSFSFFNLATTPLPHSSIQETPFFCDKVMYSFPFSRDAVLLSSRVLPPTLCFSSLFLSHVLWLHCSLVLALYTQIVCCSLDCAAVRFTGIFDLLTAVCKSSQERCTSPRSFPDFGLWSSGVNGVNLPVSGLGKWSLFGFL